MSLQFSVFQFVPSVLSLGTLGKFPALLPPVKYFIIFTHIHNITRSLLFLGLNNSSSLSLFSYLRGSCPFTIFMSLCWSHSSVSQSVLY